MSHGDRCPRCGALVLPEEHFCQRCGAALEGESASSIPVEVPEGQSWSDTLSQQGVSLKKPVDDAAAQFTSAGVPMTIEALKAFCDRNGMPLEKMRFFVGVDYRQPRAFGIYRDGDEVVVYKNKADGSRAVRYQGQDEAYGVKELYDKLLQECHNRNIWPGGKPREVVQAERRTRRKTFLIVAVVVAVIIAIGIVAFVAEQRAHRYDGYYRYGIDDTYYRYGDSWYYYDYMDDWVPVDEPAYLGDYEDHYLGDDYDRVWGGSDFKTSDAWEAYQEAHTSSSDYDSWDSGGTDWSSDW